MTYRKMIKRQAIQHPLAGKTVRVKEAFRSAGHDMRPFYVEYVIRHPKHGELVVWNIREEGSGRAWFAQVQQVEEVSSLVN